MQRVHPLQTNPEFSILRTDYFHEYRVENWHLARDGSGSVIRHTSPWSWKHSIIPLIISISWPKVRAGSFARALILLTTIFFVWTRCTQVIHESVIVLPEHGIQLETHKGLPPLTLFITRRFVPYTILRDVVINEGIKRWDIRYYLVALKEGATGSVGLEVCFPVYRDLREFVALQMSLSSQPP